MASDEQVIVLGGESETASPPPVDPTPSRSPLWLLSPVIGVLALVIAFILIPQDEPDTLEDPAGLEAPDEPPSAFVNSNDRAEEATAYGARKADVNGLGVVTSVEHGPDGWLAVSGAAPVVAHLSANAVLWEPSTIHGLEAELPVGAVGDGTLAVFGSRQYGLSTHARPVGAISNDRGSSWALVEYSGLIVVRDVAVVDDHVYVVGATGETAGFGWSESGTAALWEVIDGRLEPIPLDAAPPGTELNSIVQTSAGVMIFGKSDDAPGRWSVDGERQQLVLPSDTLNLGFVAVRSEGSRLVAIVGASSADGGNLVWESVGGFEWRETNVSIRNSLRNFALTRDGIVAPINDSDRVWLGDRGSTQVGDLYGVSGDQVWVSSVGSADGVTVFGGADADKPVLIVHGTTVHPVEVVPSTRSGNERNGWHRELTIDLSIGGLDSRAAPQGSIRVGDTLLFVTTSNVFEVETSSEGLLVTPVIQNPISSGYTDSGAWVIAHDDNIGPTLHLLDESGDWTVEPAPMDGVFGVATSDGHVTVTGWGPRGMSAYQRGDDGEWTEMGLGSVDGVVFPSGDVFITPGDPFAAEPELHAPRISRDGESWADVEGWSVGGGFGSHLFLRSIDDPSVVSLPDELPDLAPVVIPSTAEYLRIWPWNGGLIVQDPWFLHLPNGEGGWQSIPIDIEHGVAGDVTALPGDTPRIAVVHDALLTFFAWR